LIRAADLASLENPWFTSEMIRIALNNLGMTMTGDYLNRFASSYAHLAENYLPCRTIGVVMAGNIPAVGFHDFLCVLLSGNRLLAKLSSSDQRLLPAFAEILSDNMSGWKDYISFTTGILGNFDAIIATGSTNTSRYFEHYFGRYPHIIRGHRNSVAVVGGEETSGDLVKLASDIMLFFGMGCRSVSRLYVPRGYDFSALISALEAYRHYENHTKYRNNYEYQRSVFLVARIGFTDAGCILLKEDPAIASPIAVLHYDFYDATEQVAAHLRNNSESVQCVVTSLTLPVNTVPFGKAQSPALGEFADSVDTMEFLLTLRG
jgi:hypothetical protein